MMLIVMRLISSVKWLHKNAVMDETAMANENRSLYIKYRKDCPPSGYVGRLLLLASIVLFFDDRRWLWRLQKGTDEIL